MNSSDVASTSHGTLSNFDLSLNVILCGPSGSCRTHEWIKIMMPLFYAVLHHGILTLWVLHASNIKLHYNQKSLQDVQGTEYRN